MKLSQALHRLKGMTAWDSEPQLSEAELVALLHEARRPDADGNLIEDVVAWEPDTAYVVGDRVTALDGYAYVCTAEGISGRAEPAWDEVTTDGEVTWERDGESAWTPTYDVNHAAAEAWTRKAGKAAAMVSFQADNARFDRDQVIANCLTMAELYRSRIVATVTVPHRRAPRRRRRA